MERQDRLELEAALKEWGLWKSFCDSHRELGYALPKYGPGKRPNGPTFYLPRTELCGLSHAVAALKRTNMRAGRAIDNKFIFRLPDSANGKRCELKRHALKELMKYAYGYIHALRPMYAGAAMEMTEQDLSRALGEA